MKRKVMSKSNRIFYIVNTVLLMICLLLVAMPILNVVASSLSSPSAVIMLMVNKEAQQNRTRTVSPAAIPSKANYRVKSKKHL